MAQRLRLIAFRLDECSVSCAWNLKSLYRTLRSCERLEQNSTTIEAFKSYKIRSPKSVSTTTPSPGARLTNRKRVRAPVVARSM